jgi:hypothetical protein
METKDILFSVIAKARGYIPGNYIPVPNFKGYRINDHVIEKMEEQKINPREVLRTLKKGKQYLEEPGTGEIIIIFKDKKIVANKDKRFLRTVIKSPSFMNWKKKWGADEKKELKDVAYVRDLEELAQFWL